MQKGLSIFLVLALIFAGGYFYKTASAVCDAPVAYRIGALDPDFELSEDEARGYVADAESLWEDSTGRNLFTYDEEAEFTINFIYDTRQAATEEEQKLSETLEEKRNMSEEVQEQYEEMLREYNGLIEHYESQTESYNERLREHNAEVARWNEQGGAPADVYEQLEMERLGFEREGEELEELEEKLSGIARQINDLGERGNSLVRAYNGVVDAYNNTFGGEREFTQGDYQGDSINIYQFEDAEELRLVLAHELGHALSIDHVENDESVMHYLMGGQRFEQGLSEEDLAEFQRICGDGSFTLWPARW